MTVDPSKLTWSEIWAGTKAKLTPPVGAVPRKRKNNRADQVSKRLYMELSYLSKDKGILGVWDKGQLRLNEKRFADVLNSVRYTYNHDMLADPGMIVELMAMLMTLYHSPMMLDSFIRRTGDATKGRVLHGKTFRDILFYYLGGDADVFTPEQDMRPIMERLTHLSPDHDIRPTDPATKARIEQAPHVRVRTQSVAKGADIKKVEARRKVQPKSKKGKPDWDAIFKNTPDVMD